MFPEYLIPYIAYVVALVICGVAIWKGDQPLRQAATVLIVAWALTPIFMGRDRHILDYPITIIDTSTALIQIWISMRWRRIWCAILAALTILIVLVPFVHLSDPGIHLYNRYAANNILSNFQLVVIAAVTWSVIRDRRRAGEGVLQP